MAAPRSARVPPPSRAARAHVAVAGAAGHAIRAVVRYGPGLAGAVLMTWAGWMLWPALGAAVAGGFCLALDHRREDA
ncbi:hypothetical protein ACIRL2_29140 [Embleya sp. NPDC127516]|uniref:hypothetical protein n=1 Tax=Embleya sp. NPDC127516 TaxID=3363990 RepID=UPI003808F7CA